MSDNEIRAVEIQEQRIESGTKWSGVKAFLGFYKLLVDPATIAFAVFTIIVINLLFTELATEQTGLIILGWIIMSCLFVTFASLKKAISVAIENAKITIEAKASIAKTLTGDANKMITDAVEAVKSRRGE